jgi:hypothetical protein
MTFPELGKLDFTDAQAKGFAIQFAEDTDSKAPDLPSYIGLILLAVADSYASRHISTVQKQRIAEAFDAAPDKAAFAAAVNVDITIADTIKADPAVLVKP